jgi:hypothetical protein
VTPGTTPPADSGPADPLDSPRGYVAFALPDKKK